MDAQDFRNLQEAYNQVHQLDEGKVELDQERRSRMGRQIGKKVRSAEAEYSLSKDTMYPKGLRGAMENGARKKVEQAQKIMGALKSAQKEQVDIYDIILSHLLDEGYAETPEAAEVIMVNMSEEWRDSIVEEVLDEAEGSYGQTPKASAAYGALTNKRRAKPASEYPQRGAKKVAVSSAEKHLNRSRRTAADHSGKKSTPSRYTSGRQGFKMTQQDRDYSRGQAEHGHTGYDPDWDGGPSGPGGKPKGKKLERQRKTGTSAD